MPTYQGERYLREWQETGRDTLLSVFDPTRGGRTYDAMISELYASSQGFLTKTRSRIVWPIYLFKESQWK
jgi:hypothetical protein